MPKVSKETAANVQDYGPPGKEWMQVLDGYQVSMVTTRQDADLTPLLVGLPNDRCPSPRWGYGFKGSMWFRYGDREEIIEAGNAFYIPPGHTSGGTAGSEFVIFSPDDVMAEVDAHMARRGAELQAAAG